MKLYRWKRESRRRSRQAGRLLAGTLAALLLATAGCGNSVESKGPGCRTDADCGGTVCNTQLRVCMPAAEGAPGIEVWPPIENNHGWVMQEFPGRALDAESELVLGLQPGVAITGSVYSSETQLQADKLLIPSRIVAYRDSLLAGRPQVQFETSQVSTTAIAPGQQQGFELWVNAGQTYSFYVAPTKPWDTLFPPLVMTGVKVEGHRGLDFVLEGKDRHVEVSGQVNIWESPLPADLKVRVRAFRPGGLQHSTIGETDKTGSFLFRVPAGVDSYTIRVESAPDSPPVPAMDCTGRVLGLLKPTSHRQDIGVLKLPAFVSPKTPFSVLVTGPGGEPVPNAAVTFTTDDLPSASNLGFEACTARYTKSGMTDASGKLSILLLAGDATRNRIYSVTVVSPPTSPFANQWIPKLEVASPGVLKAIQLSPRYLVSGRLTSEDDRPVDGATIQARGISLGETQAALPPGEATARTDPDGRFQLYVDPGVYNFDVQPPDGSGLPSFGITSRSIYGNAEGWNLKLPSAQALRGKVVVRGGREVDVPNAQVQVYELVPDTDRPVTHRAALRARSMTDAAGTFYLVLPPPAGR